MAKTRKKPAKEQCIRLACVNCDRTDGDGVEEIPKDWAEVDPIPAKIRGPSDWWTHLGWCPECKISMGF